MSGDHFASGHDAFAPGLLSELSPQLLAFALAHTPEAVLIVRAPRHHVADGKIVFAKKAFECMCGYTQAEFWVRTLLCFRGQRQIERKCIA